MKRKVWVLLYQLNEYPPQPDKALQKLWFDKPTLEQVQAELGEGGITYPQYFELFIDQVRFTEAGTYWWIDIIEE
jgi:hypothetical protein